MKRINIFYWIITALFGAFMLFTAIPDVLMTKETVGFMTLLGYPDYFIPFIGIAKVLGVIAILIPGFPRIKEWAYAGLFFDLCGALYSLIVWGARAHVPIGGGIAFMMLPIVLLFVSYGLYHKRLAGK